MLQPHKDHCMCHRGIVITAIEAYTSTCLASQALMYNCREIKHPGKTKITIYVWNIISLNKFQDLHKDRRHKFYIKLVCFILHTFPLPGNLTGQKNHVIILFADMDTAQILIIRPACLPHYGCSCFLPNPQDVWRWPFHMANHPQDVPVLLSFNILKEISVLYSCN